MDAILANLPPVTKGWCISTITTAILIALHKVKHINLLFIPHKAWSNQNWRLVTPFCTFGELSFDLVFTLWLMSSSCCKIENQFQTRYAQIPSSILDSLNGRQKRLLNKIIIRNRSLDFFYFFLQLSSSIILVATWVFYKRQILILELGAVLCQLFVYMESKMSPHEQVNFFGLFQFSNMYYPFVSALITIALHARISDMGNATGFARNGAAAGGGGGGGVGANGGNGAGGEGGIGGLGYGLISSTGILSVFRYGAVLVERLGQLFNHPLVWFYLMSFGLGHFWWCSREFLLNGLHYNDNDKARKMRKQTLKKYGVQKFDLVREILVILLLPPWYWVILSKIKQDTRQ